jgi:hypothetical protein
MNVKVVCLGVVDNHVIAYALFYTGRLRSEFSWLRTGENGCY